MAYDEGLATRIREVLGERPGLAEKQMFGGLAFLVHGNMACGVRGDDLIVRVAADTAEAALAEPGTRPFDLTGRPMRAGCWWTLTATPRTTSSAAGSTGASPTPTRCRLSNRASHQPSVCAGSCKPHGGTAPPGLAAGADRGDHLDPQAPA